MEPVSSFGKHRALGFLAAFFASCFWGCGFFLGKIALGEMNFGAMVLYRFVFATLGLLPLLLAHRPRFNAAEWRMLLFAALLGFPSNFSSSSKACRSPQSRTLRLWWARCR